MITFAGVPLTAPDSRALAFFDQWWHCHGIREHNSAPWMANAWAVSPKPPHTEQQKLELGVLTWPTESSRWATFHHLASGAQLAAIRAAIEYTYTYADPPTARTVSHPGLLTISDGTNSQSAWLTMLPPKPICTEAGAELYLLSLVDRRYYLWSKNCVIDTTPASWTGLFSSLYFHELHDAVPAAYPPPSELWQSSRLPLPRVQDAAVACVGSRVRWQLQADGSSTAYIVRWPSAKADLDYQWSLHKSRAITGGRIPLCNLNVPMYCRVVFHNENTGAVLVSLRDLNLSEFGTNAGVLNWNPTTGYGSPSDASSASVWIDASENIPWNAPTDAPFKKIVVANQAASDFYRWQLADIEAAFTGVVPWRSTGAEDRVEWRVKYDSGEPTISTTVYRAIYHEPGPLNTAPVPRDVISVMPTREAGWPDVADGQDPNTWWNLNEWAFPTIGMESPYLLILNEARDYVVWYRLRLNLGFRTLDHFRYGSSPSYSPPQGNLNWQIAYAIESLISGGTIAYSNYHPIVVGYFPTSNLVVWDNEPYGSVEQPNWIVGHVRSEVSGFFTVKREDFGPVDSHNGYQLKTKFHVRAKCKTDGRGVSDHYLGLTDGIEAASLKIVPYFVAFRTQVDETEVGGFITTVDYSTPPSPPLPTPPGSPAPPLLPPSPPPPPPGSPAPVPSPEGELDPEDSPSPPTVPPPPPISPLPPPPGLPEPIETPGVPFPPLPPPPPPGVPPPISPPPPTPPSGGPGWYCISVGGGPHLCQWYEAEPIEAFGLLVHGGPSPTEGGCTLACSEVDDELEPP